MANNRIQIKRTTVTGRTPNTTNSGNTHYIDVGELAFNITDRKLFSSNGSTSFEVGSNLTSLAVGSIVANGSLGTAGQTLTTNSTGVYWSSAGAGTVSSVGSGNGLTGGPITSTGTLSVLANTGIVANATGLYVNPSYIGTLSSNSAAYPIFSADSVTVANITGRINSGLYQYAIANTAYGWPTDANNWFHLISATHSNISNYYAMQIAGSFFDNDFYGRKTNNNGTTSWVKFWTDGNDGSGSGLDADTLDGQQGTYYAANSLLSNYQTTAGLSANVATLTSNNSTFSYGKTEGNLNVNSATTALTANNSTNLGGVAAANYARTDTADTFNGIVTFSANVVLGSVGLSANGGFGTAGQVLHSNGTATYWAADDQGVTSVATGNGLTGGTITSTGTVSALANTGIVANATGLYVNATYIGTISANNASFLGGTAAASYQLNSTLAANVATLTSNNSTFSYGKTEGNLNVNSATTALTANNSTNLGGVAAASYARLASPTFTGTVSATNITTSANLTVGSSGELVLTAGAGVYANGGLGSAGQVLHSNGTSVYWAADDDTNTTYDLLAVQNTATNSGILRLKDVSNANDDVLFVGANGITVSSNSTAILITGTAGDIEGVTAGSGLSGGGTSGTVTLNVVGNSGIVANATGVYAIPGNGIVTTNSTGIHVGAGNGVLVNSTAVAVNGNTGIVSNATGVYVNAPYIATISANNASFLGGTAAASYQLNSTLAANVATLTSNNSTFSYGKTEGALNVNSALTSNNSTYLNGQLAAYYTNATNISTGTLNNARLPSAIAVTSVNAATLSVGTSVIANTTRLAIGAAVGIQANGTIGTAGQVLTSNGTTAYWSAAAGGEVEVDIQNTNPSTPNNGRVYWNSDLGKLVVYYNDGDTVQWVEAHTGGVPGPAGPAGATGATGDTGPAGPAGPVGGSDTQIAFNDGGSANGSSSLVFTKANTTFRTANVIANNISTTTGTITTLTSNNANVLFITANNASGTAGQYLTSNSLGGAYWSTFVSNSVSTVKTTTYDTGTGTFTTDSNTVFAVVYVTGGGGGGGGADSDGASSAGGGGGGGGGTSIRWLTAAQIGATASYAVGTGGTSGSVSGGNGGNGTNSTFTCTGTGTIVLTGAFGSGGAGTGSAFANVGGALNGGNGGIGVNGDINHSGVGGGFGIGATATSAAGGNGGSSYNGGGANGPTRTAAGATAGPNATTSGSGGAGGVNTNSTAGVTGGTGAAGKIEIVEFLKG